MNHASSRLFSSKFCSWSDLPRSLLCIAAATRYTIPLLEQQRPPRQTLAKSRTCSAPPFRCHMPPPPNCQHHTHSQPTHITHADDDSVHKEHATHLTPDIPLKYSGCIHKYAFVISLVVAVLVTTPPRPPICIPSHRNSDSHIFAYIRRSKPRKPSEPRTVARDGHLERRSGWAERKIRRVRLHAGKGEGDGDSSGDCVNGRG